MPGMMMLQSSIPVIVNGICQLPTNGRSMLLAAQCQASSGSYSGWDATAAFPLQTHSSLIARKGQKTQASRRENASRGLGIVAANSQQETSGILPLRIHYHRKHGDYADWGLHVWGCTMFSRAWEDPLLPSGVDDFGVYWDVTTKDGGILNFMIHQGDIKERAGSLPHAGHAIVWVVQDQLNQFFKKPDLYSLPMGDLGLARAFWVTRDLLAWHLDAANSHVNLHASKKATLHLSEKGVEGGDLKIKLEPHLNGLPDEVLEKFPQLSGYEAFRIPQSFDPKALVTYQLAVSATDESKAPLDATGIQLQGVLDDLFAYDGPLGPTFSDEEVFLHLWAPTAQNVRALLYSEPQAGDPEQVLQLEEKNGVWFTQGSKEWLGKYYLYEVTVFHPSTLRIETSLANDPYSRGLSANGERSLIVELSELSLKPEDWDSLHTEKPTLVSHNDIAIYELHVRDFSAFDQTVQPHVQGAFLAFTEKNSNGVKHLRQLAEAGLTHVHLLPTFDFASVDERKETWKALDAERLANLPPDSEEQQAAVAAIQDEDAYNWGYDPVNWGVPEGSYTLNPNSSLRTLEFRTMVQALNRLGLRVVLDVVYNHLHSSGPLSRYSVLDKVVPGYYLRRNKDGLIENSTCMNNTASEHYMVDRIIVDDLQHWATQYQVDGFRFDLMGHLMKRTMVRAKTLLQNLTIAHNGVDGSKLYLYGEGWDFGEIAHNGRGVNASQLNLADSGIGSFNDRIRDTVLGGSPFGDPLQQGFLTGLSLQPNGLDQGDQETMARALASTTDWILLGLAGNLRDYVFTNHKGEKVKGMEVLTFDKSPVAYAASPVETVNYVSAHDNETLFDIIMLKTSKEVSLEDRCRINHMASSIVAFSQGIPFFHAGDDLLRSKSLDRDSYNSGDWFNRLDFSYESNNWGVGLPPKEKNEGKWPLMRELLANSNLKPRKDQIVAASNKLLELLKIRYSSPLFRLKTANDVQARLQFYNTGPASIPGVIVMRLVDGDDGKPGLLQLDPNFRQIVVIFNARPTQISLQITTLKDLSLTLHPIHIFSADKVVQLSKYDANGTFHIPSRTTSVFVESR
ncbi:hypothetical protein O6H91_17G037200 [Diphasiastrum complanatum]|uniref:Uncharacterized protein n=1 Tax=Diphasiastrum complanatum TaxID=34168 RepID=A0ACC2B5U3_DIPCM|nr:hypothetical protein O6H91_17G037200 [Diphasiastrum complanatum]